MSKPNNDARPEPHQLTIDVVVMKNRLMRAGLYKTAQAMEEVTRVIGWEIAEQLPRTIAAEKGERT